MIPVAYLVKAEKRAEEKRVKALPEKYRRHIREEQKLLDLIARAHAVHDERVREAG